MIFRELLNAAFCFSLRRPGAEIMGGGVQTPPPPPSRRWKIQRPSRARVNVGLCPGHDNQPAHGRGSEPPSTPGEGRNAYVPRANSKITQRNERRRKTLYVFCYALARVRALRSFQWRTDHTGIQGMHCPFGEYVP